MNQANLKLRKLSDKDLLQNADASVSKKRATTLEVLQYLREIEVRRLYVELGYSSMYKMCLQHYKYSEGQAHRRLSAARLLTELPEIESKLQSGDLNLTTLSKVQSFVRAEKQVQHALSKQDKLNLLEELENKSTRETEVALIKKSRQPEILMEKFHLNGAVSISSDLENASDTDDKLNNNNLLNFEHLVKFEAFLNEENQKLLEEFKNLYAHEISDMSSLTVLKLLLNKAIAVKKKKLGLTNNNAPMPSSPNVDINLSSEMKVTDRSCGAEKSTHEPGTTPARPHISIHVKRALWQRAQNCCEFIDSKTKTRCSSQHALEIDHWMPIAVNGDSSMKNLALHCRAHNSRRAVKTFGPYFDK